MTSSTGHPLDDSVHAVSPRSIRHRPSANRRLIRVTILTIALLSTVAMALLKIVEKDEPSHNTASPARGLSQIKPVRVLIGSGIESVRFRSDGPISVEDAGGSNYVEKSASTWIECQIDDAGLLVNDRAAAPPILIGTDGGESVSVSSRRDNKWTEPIEYAGVMRVELAEDGSLLVINEVDLESYVASVTAHEIWPGFHEEAILAQAIVARTYAAYQMNRRRAATFDVSATQGSQVYKGVRRDTTGVNARQATKQTRGLVLTLFDGTADQLFCAYYSAACGGMTQSAAIFGSASNVEPLAGCVPCDFCRIAPGQTYRWGPVKISLDELAARLTARYPEVEALTPLRSFEVSETTSDGRAVMIRLDGENDTTLELLAERFRLVVGAAEIRSTHFRLKQKGRTVVFEDGRGFGHGLGLCQWGAEGQAREGRTAGEILRYYYAGAKLTRAY